MNLLLINQENLMSMGRTVSVLGIALLSGLILTKGITSRNTFSNHQSENHSSGSITESKSDSWQIAEFPNAKSHDQLKRMLEGKLPGLKVNEIEKSPIKGYYQVFYDSELLYVSVDGRFLFTGTMIELGDERPINHTQLAMIEADKRRAPLRAELIASVDEDDMVVFKAKEEKHVVTVFTDVDCAYCRKLHREIPGLNALGITVRYMAYPRAGIGSDAYRKLVSVWCADNKLAAMDDAKLKRQFSDKSCKSPVAAQYNMVRNLQLSGTPAVITETGEVIGGYLSAKDMHGLLQANLMSGQSESVDNSGK